MAKLFERFFVFKIYEVMYLSFVYFLSQVVSGSYFPVLPFLILQTVKYQPVDRMERFLAPLRSCIIVYSSTCMINVVLLVVYILILNIDFVISILELNGILFLHALAHSLFHNLLIPVSWRCTVSCFFLNGNKFLTLNPFVVGCELVDM